MSILSQYRIAIEKLQAENKALKAEKEATDKDIQELAISFKKTWGSLDIDLEKFKSKNKISAITTVLSKLAKKEVQETLENEWQNVSALLKKYEHLTTEDNGR